MNYVEYVGIRLEYPWNTREPRGIRRNTVELSVYPLEYRWNTLEYREITQNTTFDTLLIGEIRRFILE